MTTWTKITKPVGVSWSTIGSPITTTPSGTPVGLLLTLTTATPIKVNTTIWSKITKPAGTSWTKITKPT